jgi:uncharacterized cupin superfamily protein
VGALARRVNIADPAFAYDAEDPAGYGSGGLRLGKLIGGSMLGMSVYELPPGQAICPYHYEYGPEEWLIVLDGKPTLRHPEGEEVVEPGDLVCFPEGPDGAHKLTNRTDSTVRLVLLSTKGHPNAAVYPDSDKIGLWTGNDADKLLVKRESNVDYFEGEL